MKKVIDAEEYKELLILMLKDFHDFCQKNEIKYYAGYGTLLGAVRHKGFIPWDDDLDVVMLRDDYDRFLMCAKEWNSEYKVKSFQDDEKYPYNFAKVYDKRTSLKEFLWNDYDMGVYIDVFPLDEWPKDESVIGKIRNIQKLIKIKAYRIGPAQGLKKNLVLSVLKPLFGFKSLEGLLKEVERCCNICEKVEGYIGNVTSNNYGLKERMEKRWFANQTILQFEDTVICAPLEYDKILHHLYGDYMTPPPLDKQQSHHTFSAWWKE